ncbi:MULTISPECIES: fimbrial protein [unclassified Erwinia]|uniref:fimbrial protein n=1 Tax=unclassified Erwinia TaxID=2622719 RepID=UPI000C18A79F|nr:MULTISPECIES: fimbrial protein [unclassified Erwinia]
MSLSVQARPLAEHDHGHGQVSVQGAIIDTPCAIAVESRDQSIVMATLPVTRLLRDGQGPKQVFSIHLINCTLTPALFDQHDWSKFRVTFDGPVSDGSLFALKGEGKGIGLQISDSNGNVALPGQAMPAGLLQPPDMIIRFYLRLVENHQPLRVGSYGATIRFKLDYY